jgi:putative ATP-binding cassette transporter
MEGLPPGSNFRLIAHCVRYTIPGSRFIDPEGAMAGLGLDAKPAPRPEGAGRRLWRLVRDYYGSEEWRSAWGLTLGVVLLTVLQIAIQVRLNLWNRDFFDALEQRDREVFLGQMGLFALLALAGIAAAVFQLQVRQVLQLRWRRWLVHRMQERLLTGNCHYRLQFLEGAADNPDQRISENTRWATAMAVDMAVGLLHSVLLLASFAGILWTLSGPLPVSLGGHGFEIPGYMVFAALVYAAIGTGLTWLIGRPLVGINSRRNEAESDHRFALVRLRENAEGVTLIRGEADEERGLRHSFSRVLAVMRDMYRGERRLMGLSAAYGMVTHIFPILVAAPRYFAGAITLGVLMQVGQAFYEVTRALNWFMANYPRLADWASHVERSVELEDSLAAAAAVGQGEAIRIEEGPLPDGREVLSLSGLSLATPGGALLITGADAEIRPGERVLIQGESGTGKSTLFRAIAGAWPWGAGRIRVPAREGMMFMPQRPYLPLGALRQAVAYPAPPGHFPDATVRAALARCGLAPLAGRLDEAARWDRILSLGEQQRLAFARLLLHRPRWVFMDEATAALDEANQDLMMRLFREELAGSALVSIGHRPGLDAYHDRTLVLQRAAAGARLGAPGLAAVEGRGEAPALVLPALPRMAVGAPARHLAGRRRRPHADRRLRGGTRGSPVYSGVPN